MQRMHIKIRIVHFSLKQLKNKEEKILDIKVLGPGCSKCRQTENIVKEAVAEAGIAANVEMVYLGHRRLSLTVRSKVSARYQKNRMLLAGSVTSQNRREL